MEKIYPKKDREIYWTFSRYLRAVTKTAPKTAPTRVLTGSVGSLTYAMIGGNTATTKVNTIFSTSVSP